MGRRGGVGEEEEQLMGPEAFIQRKKIKRSWGVGGAVEKEHEWCRRSNRSSGGAGL